MIELFEKYVLGQWRLVLSDPIPFIMSIVVVAIVLWFVFDWGYGREISLLKQQLADYKDKLNGATPDQAKAKIADLERRVNLTIGSKWEPLSKDESSRLTAAVAKLTPRKIQVMYVNQLGRSLAQSIADAFVAAGWSDMHFSEGGGLGIGVSTGRGNGMALKLKEAIETSTRFNTVHSFGPTEPDYPGVVFVGVGINPD
jgi:hypothetical protein